MPCALIVIKREGKTAEREIKIPSKKYGQIDARDMGKPISFLIFYINLIYIQQVPISEKHYIYIVKNLESYIKCFQLFVEYLLK
jgi:hypothetical protein